jgi:hypothetical protein
MAWLCDKARNGSDHNILIIDAHLTSRKHQRFLGKMLGHSINEGVTNWCYKWVLQQGGI